MSGRLPRFVPFLLSLWLVATAPQPAAAQAADEVTAAAMEIGESMGAHLNQAIGAAQQMRASAAQASAEIEAARRRYWQAFQTGRNVEAARAEFAHQLRGKDLYYMYMAIPEGADGPRARLAEIISGGLDGGIRPAARDDFVSWITAIRQHLGAALTRQTQDQMVLPSPARLAEALAATREHEAAYQRARDWAEMDLSGVTFPWDTDARLYVLMLLQRYGPARPADEVVENHRELLQLFGEAEVLAAAERVRAAPKDAAGHLRNPRALGVDSTQPDLAFTEILATTSGRTYFKYLIWRGELAIPGHTPAEAAREYDRFAWAYGEAAVEKAADSVLHLPKNAQGRIDIRGPDSPRLPGTPIQAVWTLLRRDHPEGWIRGIFAWHPEATSRADWERLRGDLERRHGAEAVAAAGRALYAFWYLEESDGPNRARRDAYFREAREAAGLPRASGAHTYAGNYPLLVRVLEEGAVAVLGEHVPARTEEQRRADRLAERIEGMEPWERRTHLIEHELRELRDRGDEGGPHAIWPTYIMARHGSATRTLLDPQHAGSRRVAALVNPAVTSIHQAVGTVQLQCDLSLDPESELCHIARLVEESAGEMWAVIRDEWPEADITPAPARGGVPDPEGALSDVVGEWSGRIREIGGRFVTLTLSLAVPASANQPLGRMEYRRAAGRSAGPYAGDLFFLGKGFIGSGFTGGLRAYSLHYRPPEGGGAPRLVTVEPRDDGQIEVIWYARQRPGGNHRRIAVGLLAPLPATAKLPPEPMAGCPDGLVHHWIDRMPERSHLTGGTVRNDTLVFIDRRAREGTAHVRFVVAPPPGGGARHIEVTGRDRRVNQQAVDLIERSMFSRGTHENRPACVWMEYTVRFQRQR